MKKAVVIIMAIMMIAVVAVIGVGCTDGLFDISKKTECAEHAWNDGVCDKCGESCFHLYNNGACCLCGVSESKSDTAFASFSTAPRFAESKALFSNATIGFVEDASYFSKITVKDKYGNVLPSSEVIDLWFDGQYLFILVPNLKYGDDEPYPIDFVCMKRLDTGEVITPAADDELRYGDTVWFPWSLAYDLQFIPPASSLPNILIEFSAPLLSIEDPVKEGYTFIGWYYDLDFTRPYDNAPITADTQLYAKFVINKYTVSFDSNGGNMIENQTIEHGSSITLPTPTRVGHTFVGWFLPDGTQYVNQPITADSMLTAHWDVIVCTVTFYVDNEVYRTVSVEYGTQLSEVINMANDLSLQVMTVRLANAENVQLDKVVVTDDSVELHAEELTGSDKALNVVKNNKWAIIGSIGGVVLLVVVIIAVCSGTKKRKKR